MAHVGVMVQQMPGICERPPTVLYPGAYVNNLINNRYLLMWPSVTFNNHALTFKKDLELIQYRDLVPPDMPQVFTWMVFQVCCVEPLCHKNLNISPA